MGLQGSQRNLEGKKGTIIMQWDFKKQLNQEEESSVRRTWRIEDEIGR